MRNNDLLQNPRKTSCCMGCCMGCCMVVAWLLHGHATTVVALCGSPVSHLKCGQHENTRMLNSLPIVSET